VGRTVSIPEPVIQKGQSWLYIIIAKSLGIFQWYRRPPKAWEFYGILLRMGYRIVSDPSIECPIPHSSPASKDSMLAHAVFGQYVPGPGK
jgi:hypothetical protein